MQTKTVSMEHNQIPVRGRFESIIVGGGTAGALAGIASARAGKHTLIIEQSGCLGGSATAGLVMPLMPSGVPGNPGHCPLSVELIDRTRRLGGVEGDDSHFDPTLLSFALEDMVCASGCQLLYHTQLAGVVMDQGRITHVAVCNKDGLSAYQADYFVDATGDGDLAHMAGERYASGDHRGLNQALSLRFEMAGIDFTAFHAHMRRLGNHSERYFAMNTPGMRAILRQACDDGVLHEQDIPYFQGFGVPGKPDAMNFNCPELTTRAGVVEAAFLTSKQVEGRAAILRMRHFLREYIEGFAQAYITHTASMVGCRESRRFEALYTLTIDDLLSYRKFDDAIISCAYPIDLHSDDDAGARLRYDRNVPPDRRYWQVPARCLIARQTPNLLIAGRCAGLDYLAQSAARIQIVCRAMGEAAGMLCALAPQAPAGLHDVDTRQVTHLLRARGMRIEPPGAGDGTIERQVL